MIGLHRPERGTIYLGKRPLQEIDKRKWHRLIGYVPQEQILLHDSILTNVTFGDPELSGTDAERALQAAGAWDFVTAMPQGIHSNVGERGATLSGGQPPAHHDRAGTCAQAQRTYSGRADQCPGPDSEQQIKLTLQDLSRDYIVLAIPHQQALVDAADRVYQLENGKLAAQP